jgi:hypothetical protein
MIVKKDLLSGGKATAGCKHDNRCYIAAQGEEEGGRFQHDDRRRGERKFVGEN